MKETTMKVIAHIHSDFPTKFGIPRQSGLVESLKAKIVFEPEYRNSDALRGMEEYSHLWLIWEFSKAKRDTWSPTVRPPIISNIPVVIPKLVKSGNKSSRDCFSSNKQ